MHTTKLLLINTGLAVCFFCMLTCFSVKKTDAKNITGIKVIASTDIADSTGGLVTWRDTTFIYYRKNYVLYFLPFTYIGDDGNEIAEKRGFTYFAHRQHAKTGLRFRFIDNINGTTHNVDSFTRMKAYTGGDYSDLTEVDLMKQSNNIGADFFTKIYLLNSKPDNGDYPDSAIYAYSNKLKDIPYTFSKELDSSSNAKLYGIKLVFRQRFYAEFKKLIPKRIMEFNFSKLQAIQNLDLLNKVFDTLEKMKL
jgi:hypothetical protein